MTMSHSELNNGNNIVPGSSLKGINKITDVHVIEELFEYLSVSERARISSVSKIFFNAIHHSRIHETELDLLRLPMLGRVSLLPLPDNTNQTYGSFFSQARSHVAAQQESLIDEARARSSHIYNPMNRAFDLVREEGAVCAAVVSICLLLIGTISLATEQDAKTEDAIILGLGGMLALCAMLPKIAQFVTQKIAQRRLNLFLAGNQNNLTGSLISEERLADDRKEEDRAIMEQRI